MKRYFVFIFAALALLALGATGCTHTSRYSTARHPLSNTVALSVSVDGTEQPTPEQLAAIVNLFEPQLASYGWVLVGDLRQADRIIRVNLDADPLAPNTRGHATVLSFTMNPRGPAAMAAARASYASSSSSGGYSSSTYSSYNTSPSYERWNDTSYSSSTTSSSSPPPSPPTASLPTASFPAAASITSSSADSPATPAPTASPSP